MANKISDETIEYVGILAKLELSDEEKEEAKADMEKMLDYIDTLNELDTTGIEPMSHVFPVNNVFREDVVTNGDGREMCIRDRCIMCPRTRRGKSSRNSTSEIIRNWLRASEMTTRWQVLITTRFIWKPRMTMRT